jgi:hypothetical protein
MGFGELRPPWGGAAAGDRYGSTGRRQGWWQATGLTLAATTLGTGLQRPCGEHLLKAERAGGASRLHLIARLRARMQPHPSAATWRTPTSAPTCAAARVRCRPWPCRSSRAELARCCWRHPQVVCATPSLFVNALLVEAGRRFV